MYQKGFADIAFLVLAVALAGLAGYFVWNTQTLIINPVVSPSQTLPVPNEQNTPTATTNSNPPVETTSSVKYKVPADWQRMDRGSFTIALPPGWEYNRLQGTDSHVGEFAGDGMKLTYDHGWYSYPLSKESGAEYNPTYETIDGFQARLVIGNDMAGVHFADLGGDEQKVKLTITGHNLSSAQQELALQIFRSLNFK